MIHGITILPLYYPYAYTPCSRVSCFAARLLYFLVMKSSVYFISGYGNAPHVTVRSTCSPVLDFMGTNRGFTSWKVLVGSENFCPIEWGEKFEHFRA